MIEFFRWLFAMQPRRQDTPLSERAILVAESKIGAALFGPLPKGHRREFFCLDATTWIWHESWVDNATGQRLKRTTRYEIHPHGVIKEQDGVVAQEVLGQELYNFAQATDAYMRRVAAELYGQQLGA